MTLQYKASFTVPLFASEPRRLRVGEPAPVSRFTTLSGEVVDLTRERLPVHVQFRRFAGCPICNLHLRSFVHRRSELEGVVREVVLFHSSREDLLRHAGDLPFPVVADPMKHIYRAFGVEVGRRALLDPSVWPTIVRSVLHALPGVILGRRPAPALNPEGGRFGLPADFLIGESGRILACKYGAHADDQWSVDEVLWRAKAAAQRECAEILPK